MAGTQAEKSSKSVLFRKVVRSHNLAQHGAHSELYCCSLLKCLCCSKAIPILGVSKLPSTPPHTHAHGMHTCTTRRCSRGLLQPACTTPYSVTRTCRYTRVVPCRPPQVAALRFQQRHALASDAASHWAKCLHGALTFANARILRGAPETRCT